MQFIVSINVKEHLDNPQRIWEATQYNENTRAFEFRKPCFEPQLLSGCSNEQVTSPSLISVFSSGKWI